MANKLQYLGEDVSDARLADIVLQGLPPSYDQLRLMADIDSHFTFAMIEKTARNMFKSRSRGRNTPNHSSAECKAQAAARQAGAPSSGGTAVGPTDNSTAAAASTAGPASTTAASSHQASASTAPSAATAPQAATEPYSGSTGFSWLSSSAQQCKLCDFLTDIAWWVLSAWTLAFKISLVAAGCGLFSAVASWSVKLASAWWSVGSSWTTSSTSAATAASASHDAFSMLVDSGASAHFVDSELIPGLQECMQSYEPLVPPMIITTAGMRRVYGTAAGMLPCAVTDTDGVERRITVRVVVVPGMGKHLFSPKFAQRHGIHTLFTDENYIDAVNFKVGLRHSELLDHLDLRLVRSVPARHTISGTPHVRDDTPSPTSPVALATVATSADVWHRRLGHPNEAVVRAVAKIPETGVVLSGAMSKCDTLSLIHI